MTTDIALWDDLPDAISVPKRLDYHEKLSNAVLLCSELEVAPRNVPHWVLFASYIAYEEQGGTVASDPPLFDKTLEVCSNALTDRYMVDLALLALSRLGIPEDEIMGTPPLALGLTMLFMALCAEDRSNENVVAVMRACTQEIGA